jgi:TPR repeat protein
MIALASWFSDNRSWASMGVSTDAFSALGFYRRAYLAGEAAAAQNMAMEHFNRNDLAGYRLWLRRAARLGDVSAEIELRCFETRLSHSSARKIGRIRPERKGEKFG